jgi:hypothetical protein
VWQKTPLIAPAYEMSQQAPRRQIAEVHCGKEFAVLKEMQLQGTEAYHGHHALSRRAVVELRPS